MAETTFSRVLDANRFRSSLAYAVAPAAGYKISYVAVNGASVRGRHELHLYQREDELHHQDQLRADHLYHHGGAGRSWRDQPGELQRFPAGIKPDLHHHAGCGVHCC